jgi:DNA-directed RNA polymerase subunit RPC12/RpoP
MDPIDARCVDCGATFPRSAAARHDEEGLACPACGHGVVRGIPEQHTALGTRTNTRCGDCGATFPHEEAKTPTKGVLACPVCGSTGELRRIDDPERT